jgi:crotonobetaine/carnitine-CoA ligase
MTFSQTVTEHLERACALRGSATFVEALGEGSLSYGEANQRADALAGALGRIGVGTGDRVVALLDNGITPVILFLACLKLGSIYVPLNTTLQGQYLERELGNADPKVIFGERAYLLPELVQRIASAHIKPRVVAKERDAMGLADGEAHLFDEPGFNFAELIAEHSGSARPVKADPGDVACILYTSGTVGDPKGCAISHNYLCHTAVQSIERTGRTAEEILWTPLPLFHINALATAVVSTIIVGGKLSLGKKFSASGFWRDIYESQAQVAHLLGGLMRIIASKPESEESRRCHGQLRFVAGVPCSKELRDTWRARFGVRDIGTGVYGMTEACQITTTRYGERHPADDDNAGHITDAFEVRIFDQHDRELSTGGVGEIVCRPRHPHIMFEGYWRNPQASLERMKNLWFHTGDYGWLDDHGWLHFAGRGEGIIRRLGENFPAEEVESALAQHPSILEAAVIAVPSDFGDEEVCAVVVALEGEVVSPRELREFAASKLPKFAVPRFIAVVDELPKNSLGKVVRRSLYGMIEVRNAWDARNSVARSGREGNEAAGDDKSPDRRVS